MAKLPNPKVGESKKLFELKISAPESSIVKTQRRRLITNRVTNANIDRVSLPKVTQKFGKYLNKNMNTNKNFSKNPNHQRRLSRGNKLYVKRILKQNKEYRQLQVFHLRNFQS